MKLGSVGASAIVRCETVNMAAVSVMSCVYLLMSEISYVDIDGKQGGVEAAFQDKFAGFRETRA